MHIRLQNIRWIDLNKWKLIKTKMLSPFGIRLSQSNWKCWIQNSHKYLRFNYVHCSHIQNDQKKLPRNKNHKLNLIIHMYLIMQGTFVQYPSTRIVLLVKCHMMFKHLCVMPHFIRLLCTQCSGRCRGSILGLDEVLCPSHRSTKLLPVTTFPTHWIRIQLDTLFSVFPSVCLWSDWLPSSYVGSFTIFCMHIGNVVRRLLFVGQTK